MAVRTPCYLDVNTPYIQEYVTADMEDIAEIISDWHGSNPAVKLEVGGTNGILLPNQNFTDTYYAAGDATAQAGSYVSEALTPDVELKIDYYNNIRIVNNYSPLPTTDANNLEYPVYLDSNNNLRAMTRQDFIDTFVLPALNTIALNDYSNQTSGGQYFLHTATSLAYATRVSATPVANDSIANVSAYTANGIPETKIQTIATPYYLYKNTPDFADGDSGFMWQRMPLYFDAGTETLRMHSLDSMGTLISPFLRYYLGGGDSNYTIDYNIDGAGTTQGEVFQNTILSPTGTGYNTRLDGATYRTQKFPTGTSTATVSDNDKRLKFTFGVAQVINLQGTQASPESFDGTGALQVPGTSNWNTKNGYKFVQGGKLQEVDYQDTLNGLPKLYATNQWCNVTPTTPYFVRFLDDVGATMSGSARVPTTGEDYSSTTDYWRVTQDFYGQYATLKIERGNVVVYEQQYQPPSSAQSVTQLTNGGKTYYRGTSQTGYSYTQNWAIYHEENFASATRVTANGGDQLGTWHPLDADREFRYDSTSSPDTTTRFMQTKVEIATDAAGSNIVDTGYYRTVWSGAATPVNGSLSTVDVYSVAAGLGTQADASWSIYPGGTITATGTGGGGGPTTITGTPQTWLNTGNASDYEVKWDFTYLAFGSGGFTSTLNQSSDGVWYNLGTTRTWAIQDSGNNIDPTEARGTVSIRKVGTTAVLASFYCSLICDQDP
jgi:hypothetical protein